jgi:hypothetical protein
MESLKEVETTLFFFEAPFGWQQVLLQQQL